MASSVKLNDEMKARVRQLADLRQRTPHWIMREAIRDYIEREEARESFRQEAAASWAAYQENGRHLSGQEVRAWLDRWGTETASPECHE